MLRYTAEILKKSCRQEDIIARWGGDEFVIFLPQTDTKNTLSICERIVGNCKGVYIKNREITIAVGCSTKESIEKNLEVVLREAEENMYRHKRFIKERNQNREDI